MATIEDRHKGPNADRSRARWRVRWRDPEGRSRAQSFTREDAAKRHKREVEDQLDRGTWIDPNSGTITLREWAPYASSSWHDLDRSTFNRYQTSIKCQILAPRFRLGDVQLRQLDGVKVQRWINDLVNSGLGAATIRKAQHVLQRLLDDAIRDRKIPTNPARAKFHLPPLPEVESRFLTPADVKRLADALGDDYRAFVVLGGLAGLRIGEIFALRWENLNLLAGTLTVAEKITESNGEQIHAAGAKTAAGVRTVPLPRRAIDELRAHAERQGGPGPDALVLPTPSGGRWRATNFRNRVWHPAVERAGLAPLVPHELRHTAVTLWIDAGASSAEVRARAGHKKDQLRYAHRYPTHGERVNARLDELFADDDEAAS